MSSDQPTSAPGRWSAVATLAGEKMAERIFTNKPGRGNARATERHLSEQEVAAFLTAAFEMGAEMAAETLKNEGKS